MGLQDEGFIVKFIGTDDFTANNILAAIKGVIYAAIITSIARLYVIEESYIAAWIIIIIGFIMFVIFEVKLIYMPLKHISIFPKKMYMALALIFSLGVFFSMGDIYFSVVTMNVDKINSLISNNHCSAQVIKKSLTNKKPL